MNIQTRSEKTGINHFTTFEEAIEVAEKDKTIWKISFALPTSGKRMILVNDMRYGGGDSNDWFLGKVS